MNQAQQTNTTQKMLRQMATRYGPIMGGTALRQALGFSSAAAMRQAVLRNQVGVQLFNLKNRRGKFALTQDVVRWLADCMLNDETVVTAATLPPSKHLTSRGLTASAQHSRCE
ncbi:hypothetical protein ACFJIX_10115 [Roseateles sp. UC29_93]|uniref:hypothetical protein n=1 Tax=Roseateles sp. UC29_93 TaxID=3350177 RepID=UPI0036721935